MSLSRGFHIFATLVLSLGSALSFSSQSLAQLDPAAALLLSNEAGSPSQNAPAREVRVESGRYSVRPRSEASARRDDPVKAPRKSTSEVGTPDVSDTSQTTVAPNEVAVKPAAVENSKSPSTDSIKTAEPVTAAPSQESPQKTPQKTPQTDGASRHLSWLEIDVAPGFLYNDSSSSYSLRRYQFASPSVSADARVWLNPTFGLQFGYLSTLSGHVGDSFTADRSVSASQQWLTAGIRSRRFYGPKSSQSHLVVGLDYFEYQFRVPGDSKLRESLRSSGARIVLEAEYPGTPTRSWTLGMNFTPKLTHKESSTAIDFTSGDGTESNGIGISVGGKFYFDSTSSIFWKVTQSVEKNLFSGTATLEDPLTGKKPTGVSVTNSFTLLQFGYSWGD